MTVPALEIIGLAKRFGGVVATDAVSLRLERGARHALIGPNGAGKTTLINLLSGVLRPSGGRILLDGRDIGALGVDARVRLGLTRTFQINRIFADLTVLEAVVLAASQRGGAGGAWWQEPGARGESLDAAVELLERFRLVDCMGERCGRLAHGRQRLVDIALALASGPRVLLLDEPAAGVAARERDDILEAVAALPRDVAVVLIEHDMDMVFRFAERVSVMVAGAILIEGTVAEIRADPRVRAVYLGEGAA